MLGLSHGDNLTATEDVRDRLDGVVRSCISRCAGRSRPQLGGICARKLHRHSMLLRTTPHWLAVAPAFKHLVVFRLCFGRLLPTRYAL